jgi:hypothetical protein
MVDGSATSEIAVTFRGTDRSILVSAADTVARELKSFPDHFSSASHQLDSSELRAKGLFQWNLRDLQGYAQRWEEIAPWVIDPKRPTTLMNQVDGAHDIFEESSENPLEPARKRMLLSAVTMLDSLDGYLEPGGVYRSTWTDPVFEQSMEKIDQLIEGFPADDPTAVTLHVVLGASPTVPSNLYQSIKILRDVARRVRLVYPSVEIVVAGSLVRQSDQQRSIEQGLALTMLVGLVGTSLLAWLTLGYRLGASLVVTILLLSGWLVGITAVRHSSFDLAVARQTILALSIAMVAPVRLAIGIRHKLDGIGSVRRSLLRPTLTAAFSAAMGLCLTALVFHSPISASPASIAEVGAIAILCSLAATAGFAWMIHPTSMPAASSRQEEASPITMSRFARLRATIGTSMVALAAIGIGRWFGGMAGDDTWNISTSWSSLPPGVVARAEANSAEEARRLARAFGQMPTVGKVVELASWIPSDQADKLPVIESLAQIATRWKDRPAHPTKLDASLFRQSLRALDEFRGTSSPADQVLVDRAIRFARQIDARLAKLSAADQDRRLASFEQLWLDDLGRQMERLNQVAKPEPVRAADLPASMSAALHPKDGPWIVMVHPKEDGSITLDRFRQEVLEVDPSASGNAITSVGTIADQLRQLLQGMGLAIAGTLVVGMLITRSTSRVALAHLPVAATFVVTAGVLGWLGMDLSSSTLSAWSFAWPTVLVASLSAGWWAIAREAWVRQGTLLVSVTLLAWSVPMMFAPEGELARIGVTLVLASLAIPIVTLVLVPGWRAILLPPDEALFGPSASPPEHDLASTVFFHDAA